PGKVGLVAGATPVLDRHHAVIAALGERFTLCRLAESETKQAHAALSHVGARESEMRNELSEAVAALFAGERAEPRVLDETERVWLVDLAELVARARSAVE